MVKVRVGADDSPQMQAVVLNEIHQGAAVQPGIARVHQHNVRVRQLIYRHQRRGPHCRIGVPINVAQLHSPASFVYILHYDPLVKKASQSLPPAGGK